MRRSRVAMAAVAIMVGASARPGAATPITPSPFNQRPIAVSAGYTPIVGDFDGDGRTDVFWYRPGPGADYVWWGTASGPSFGTDHDEFVVNGSYRPLAGDFDGDGRTDIAWAPVSRGHFYFWYGLTDRTFTSDDLGSYPGDSFTHFAGDFNGDGATDVFTYFRHGVYIIAEGGGPRSNPTPTKLTGTTINGDYTPIPADYNGDGRTDIYWAAKDPAAPSYLWVTHPGLKFTSWRYDSVAPPTSFAADFTGDGNADLFAYGPGPFAERILPGTATNIAPITFTTTVVPNVVGTYTPVVGDFDGSGKADVIWYTGNGAPSPYWIAR